MTILEVQSRRRWVQAATVSVLALIAGAPEVFAQSPQQAQAQQGQRTGAIEEIVVTARKREEALIDVPLAITAFSAQALERSGITNLRDIANATPGLQMFDFGGGILTTPIMRGMSQINTGAIETSVTIFLDGVYIVNNNALDLSLGDVERVEVVRGPQGALYGRNAFAGAVNYVTKKPGNEFESEAQATIGNDGRYAARALVSGPVIQDVLALRLSGIYDTFSGSWGDEVTNIDLGGYEKKGAQLTGVLNASESFRIDALVQLSKNTYDPSARVFLPTGGNCAPLTVANVGVFNRAFCGKWPDGKDLEQFLQYPTPPQGVDHFGNQVTSFSTNLRPTLDTAIGTFSAVFAYNRIRANQFANLERQRDGVPTLLGPAGAPVLLTRSLVFQGSNALDIDRSVELRYETDQEQRIRASLGGFYFDFDRKNLTNLGARVEVPAGRTLLNPNLNGWRTSDGRANPFPARQNQSIRQKSAFGLLEGDVTERFNLRGELRYTDEKKGQVQLANILPTLPTTGRQEGQWKFWDWRATAKYDLTDDQNLYVTAATGKRSGGFNPAAQIAAEIGYAPEEQLTYEAGYKANWLDGRVSTNVALYYIDWKDIQQAVPATPLPGQPPTGANVFQNFGKAEVKGIEFEVGASVTDEFQLNASIAYTDPKFKGETAYDIGAGNVAVCLAVASCAPSVLWLDPATRTLSSTAIAGARRAIDLRGRPLLRASKWLINLGADYSTPISGDWNVYSRVDYRYESKQYGDLTYVSTFGPRHLLGARVGIENGRFDVAAWVENLLDDTTIMSQGFSAWTGAGVNLVNANLPDRRTFGVTVKAKF
jgi:iron complex outermembrane receptor protein